MLKVFQVIECGGPGGAGNQVAALCNGLDAKRFDVGLVYAVRSGEPEDYRALCSGAKSAIHIPEFTREISPLKDLKALWRLYRLFKAEKPDVVHAHSSKAGVLARLAAKLAGVPKIFYSPRGYGFLQQDRSAPARALYRLIERCMAFIGEIVAISPSEAALSSGGKVHVVCDPVLGEFPAPAEGAEDGTLVGGCGRMTYARNLDAFVVLSQRLTDSRNGLKCVWIGGGEEEEKIRAHLQNMNMLAKVEVTGWLDAASARERMRGLDLFVHYSRWDGLPNAVLEAMALGLPVVASDLHGNRDAVVHGETGFLAKSEIELLEYSLQLIDNKALREKFGKAGRERVLKEFTLAKTLAGLEALYG